MLEVFTNPLNEMDLEIEWWHETVISSNLRVLHTPRAGHLGIEATANRSRKCNAVVRPSPHRLFRIVRHSSAFSLPRELGTDGVGLGAAAKCKSCNLCLALPSSALMKAKEERE